MNNIFSNTYNNNNINNSTPWTTQNNSRNIKIEGSYRAQFQQIRLEHIPLDGTNSSSQYGPNYSTSIIHQQEYKGMSLMMVRLEDYYLIRTKQIHRSHQNAIENACGLGLFNPKLITNVNSQTIQPPQFPNFRNSWSPNNNSNSNYQKNDLFSSNNNNSTNIFNQNNSSQLFQTQAPTNNIFNVNKENQNTPNLFKPQQTTQNIFQQQQPQQSANIFNQNPTKNIFQPQNQPIPNQTQNIFAQQPQQNMNLFNQQIFPQNNQMQQNTNNLFNSNNLFGQQQNLFAQPNLSQSNIFTQPNYFNNQLTYSQYPYYQPYQYQMQQYQIQPQQQLLYYQNPPQGQQIEKVKDTAEFLFQCAETLNKKYQQFKQLKEQEEQRFEQQELVIQECERQNQEFRKQNERIFNQPPSTRSNKSRSPSPFSVSRAGKSSTGSIAKFSSSLQRSHITENNMIGCQSPNNDNFGNQIIIDVIIKFLESEKQDKISKQFKSKSRIEDVKFFVENYLTQKNIFGKNRYQYFQLVRITTEQDYILDDSTLLERCQNVIIFNYFPTIKPKLTKQGYKCNCNFDEMSEKELQNIEEFTLSNQFGSAKWISPSNLLYIDLDKIIDLTQECIIVYGNENLNSYLKPNIGKKLNKECEITFKLPSEYNISNPSRFEENLRQQAKNKDIDFLNFNLEDRSYTFKVNHFSCYKFNSTDFIFSSMNEI